MPLTLPEGQPGNTTKSSINQMLETTSRFWEAPEARFSPMTYMSEVGKGTVPRKRGRHTAPARLRPRPLSWKWPALLLLPLQLRKWNTSNFVFQGPLAHDSRTPETQVCDGMPGRETQTCKVSHFIYSCCLCGRHPCPAQTRMADGPTWEPGHHTCKISTAVGTERPVRPAAATRGLLPGGAERLPSMSWEKGASGNTRKKRC